MTGDFKSCHSLSKRTPASLYKKVILVATMVAERTGLSPATDFPQNRRDILSRFFERRARVRHYFQAIVLLVVLLIGLQFAVYVFQVGESGIATLDRPAGVEGFLPIGALISWKRFLITGVWDDIHPAAMVIFGFAVVISWFAHKAFCSWFCPIGTVAEACWKIGQYLFGKTFQLPAWLDIPLRSIKYMLLGFFLWITWTMSVEAISAFIASPYYKISDVKMLHFFTRMSLTTAIVLSVLFIGSLFIKNFWCRYFCPYGALMGLVSLASPLKVRRSARNCTRCSKCTKSCPHRIDLMNKTKVTNPECSGCMDCVIACPQSKALRFGLTGKHHAWSPFRLGGVVFALFIVVYLAALVTGNWHSQLPADDFRQLLLAIDSGVITHPGI